MWKGRGPEGRAIGPFAVGSRRLSMANPSAFPYPSTGHGLQPHLMLSRMNHFYVTQYAREAQFHKIMVMPTQVVFDPSGREVARHIGYWPKDEFLAALAKVGLK